MLHSLALLLQGMNAFAASTYLFPSCPARNKTSCGNHFFQSARQTSLHNQPVFAAQSDFIILAVVIHEHSHQGMAELLESIPSILI
jgi:hypothetical protein